MLLGHMVENKIPFMMEVCQRTVLDVKGGLKNKCTICLLERKKVLDHYINILNSKRFQ